MPHPKMSNDSSSSSSRELNESQSQGSIRMKQERESWAQVLGAVWPNLAEMGNMKHDENV